MPLLVFIHVCENKVKGFTVCLVGCFFFRQAFKSLYTETVMHCSDNVARKASNRVAF